MIHLEKHGFKQHPYDPCIYLHHEANGQLDVIVALYVDDIIIISNPHGNALQQTKQILSNEFNMKDEGELSWYVGIKINQDHENNTISMSQRAYTETVLERFNMQDCAPVAVPMMEKVSHAQCPGEGSSEQREMTKVPYRKAIGCLLYLSTCTRPDIALAVSKLAKYVQNPGRVHWQALKHLMRYLKGTLDYGLRYTSNGNGELEGWADASYGDDLDNRRSTTGYLFQLSGNTITWTSYSQQSCARSTTEAEYMSLSDSAQEAVWLRNQDALRSYQVTRRQSRLYRSGIQSGIPQTDQAYRHQVSLSRK